MASMHGGHRTRAMSRIPMRITNTTNTPERKEGQTISTGINKQTRKMKDQLSPLQKLQLDYQGKLQLEKEKKMTFLYEKWSEEALKRVEKHSGKRSHKLVQDENVPGHHLPKKGSAPTGYSDSSQRRLAISAQLAMRQRQRKPQKLPPLNNLSKARSFHITGSENQKSSLATPPRKVRNGNPLSLHNVPEDPPSKPQNPAIQDEEGHSSPPPNIQHLRLLRERKLRQKMQMSLERESRSRENPEDMSSTTRKKMSDFERWQQGQVEERMERLKKHYAQQNKVRNHHLTSFNQKPVDTVSPHDQRKHKPPNNTFVAPTVNMKRSMSPVVRKQFSGQTIRQETLRQGMENDKRIAELEREMKQKQLDLKRMQEREKRSRLNSISNAASGSEYDSDHEIRFTSSQPHTPIFKPVKVPSKRFGQSNHSIFSAEDDDSNSSEIGFQMKPVLVRRDASRGSNRSTPQKDKTYLVQKPKIRRNPRNQTFMSPKLKIREEEEFEHPHPVTPPLLPHGSYNLDNLESEEDVVLDLVPCRICRRKFTAGRLAKHTKVCAQTQGKMRKVFDMTKARTQGTDAAKYIGMIKSPVPQKKKKSSWRQKHQEFINNIRNAKLVKEHLAHGGKLSDLPPPPPSENPDYVKCRYCKRKFDPAVAERHIPRCKDIKSRPKPPRRR